jgi:hypothetical protein
MTDQREHFGFADGEASRVLLTELAVRFVWFEEEERAVGGSGSTAGDLVTNAACWSHFDSCAIIRVVCGRRLSW